MIFFWFIGFCYMSDQWRQEPEKNKDGWNGRNSVQTAIVFSFFSILIWVGATRQSLSRKCLLYLVDWLNFLYFSSLS